MSLICIAQFYVCTFFYALVSLRIFQNTDKSSRYTDIPDIQPFIFQNTNKAVIRGYKAMDVLAISQKLKILWHFNMGVDGKILKCAISWKQLIVERNGRKFTTGRICRIILMPECLSLVWGHSVHFAKFPILRVSKRYSFNSFHQISTKLHAKYPNQGLIWAITFLIICQKLPKWRHLEIFLNTEPYGAGNFKTLLLQQFSSDPIQTF